MLEITAERCAHQRSALSTCQACVNACPTQAWSMGEEGLSFDEDLCDSCGLCVQACPLEALAMLAPAVQEEQEEQEEPMRRHFFNRILQRPSQVLIGQNLTEQESATEKVRAPYITSARREKARTAAQNQQPPLWAVALDVERCTFCLACVRLCPEEAITFTESSQGEQAGKALLQLNMHRCIGCNLCVDSCDQGALHSVTNESNATNEIKATQPAYLARHHLARHNIALFRQVCARCSTRFYQPVAANQVEKTVCPTCQQGRPAQFNRLVQAG